MSFLSIGIAKQLGKTKRIKDGWLCCCGAHKDKNLSLSFSCDQHHQKLLAYCFAGCLFWWESIKSGGYPKGIKLSNHVRSWRMEDMRALTDILQTKTQTRNQA